MHMKLLCGGLLAAALTGGAQAASSLCAGATSPAQNTTIPSQGDPLTLSAALLAVQPPTHAQTEGPTTEFEDNGASDWTSLEGEQAFLAAVAEGSDRVAITEIGRSDCRSKAFDRSIRFSMT